LSSIWHIQPNRSHLLSQATQTVAHRHPISPSPNAPPPEQADGKAVQLDGMAAAGLFLALLACFQRGGNSRTAGQALAHAARGSICAALVPCSLLQKTYWGRVFSIYRGRHRTASVKID